MPPPSKSPYHSQITIASLCAASLQSKNTLQQEHSTLPAEGALQMSDPSPIVIEMSAAAHISQKSVPAHQ